MLELGIPVVMAVNMADILEKNGLRKNFLRNYVEGLSPAAYAEIYSALPVSSKIIHYFSE